MPALDKCIAYEDSSMALRIKVEARTTGEYWMAKVGATEEIALSFDNVSIHRAIIAIALCFVRNGSPIDRAVKAEVCHRDRKCGGYRVARSHEDPSRSDVVPINCLSSMRIPPLRVPRDLNIFKNWVKMRSVCAVLFSLCFAVTAQAQYGDSGESPAAIMESAPAASAAPSVDADGVSRANAALDAGNSAFNRKDYAAAFHHYSDACGKRQADGCGNLAWLNEQGLGVKIDYKKAAALYATACDGGSIWSCNNLGVLYERGAGVPKNRTRAASLFAKSCDHGRVEACYFLGKIYAQGDGLKQNYQRAAILHAKACEKGGIEGCYELGLLYNGGLGVAQDHAYANRLFRKACSANIEDACFEIGWNLYAGQGVAKNLAESNIFFGLLCGKGNMTACNNVGWNFENGGFGVIKNYKTAVMYYRKACEGGDSAACVNLGHSYEFVKGVSKDMDLAKAYYSKACDLGSSIGCSNYSNLTRPVQTSSLSASTWTPSSRADDGGDFIEWQNSRYQPPPYVPPPPVTPIGGSGGLYGCVSPPCM